MDPEFPPRCFVDGFGPEVIPIRDARGVRIISNLVDLSPDELEIGLPVELVWEDMSADLAIPRFRPSAKETPQ